MSKVFPNHPNRKTAKGIHQGRSLTARTRPDRAWTRPSKCKELDTSWQTRIAIRIIRWVRLTSLSSRWMSSLSKKMKMRRDISRRSVCRHLKRRSQFSATGAKCCRMRPMKEAYWHRRLKTDSAMISIDILFNAKTLCLPSTKSVNPIRQSGLSCWKRNLPLPSSARSWAAKWKASPPTQTLSCTYRVTSSRGRANCKPFPTSRPSKVPPTTREAKAAPRLLRTKVSKRVSSLVRREATNQAKVSNSSLTRGSQSAEAF